MRRRAVILSMLASAAFPAQAQSVRYELENSLTERAKWRSFGNKDWITGDPIERARSGRSRVTTLEPVSYTHLTLPTTPYV